MTKEEHIKYWVDTADVRIEAKTYPTDYFRNSDPFIEEIKKDGIVILSR